MVVIKPEGSITVYHITNNQKVKWESLKGLEIDKQLESTVLEQKSSQFKIIIDRARLISRYSTSFAFQFKSTVEKMEKMH